jgi:Flp pilus assembly protein TadD
MDPNASTHTLYDQGRALLEENEDAQALRCLRAAHLQAPNHARIRSYYGLAVARADKQFTEAVELCNSSLKQEFFNPELYFNAARVYMLFDFKADAIRCLKRGRMIDPSNKAISSMLGELGMRKGPLLRFLPRNHRVNVWLGQARHRIRRPRAAAAA